MALFSFGVSYKTAPVSIREKVAFSTEQMVNSIADLKQQAQIDEAVIVSTCNRTEIFVTAKAFSQTQALAWLAHTHSIEAEQLTQVVYFYQDKAVTEHLMSVACGLDSMVLGEPQILGQLKQAYAVADTHNFVSSSLARLFQMTFSVAKDVRTNTDIGSSAVSVAFAAVSLAKHIFSDLSQNKVLLVGAGETTELVARHLAEAGCNKMTVANRSVQRAETLAEIFNAEVSTLSQIPELLVNADIVVSSTASQLPLVGKGMVETAMKLRKNRPMFVVDLAVPRDVESQVNDIDNVYLYTVDDLQGIVQKNQEKRQDAAEKAKLIIEQEVIKYHAWLESLKSVDYVRSYRANADDIKQALLQKAVNQINQGAEVEKVLAEFANKLTNQLVHSPTVALNKAAAEKDKAKIEFLAKHLGVHSES